MSASYVARRLAYMVFNIWVVVTIAFILFRLLPGNAADVMIDPLLVDPERRAALVDRLGLSDPLPLQYWKYMVGLVQGDLGVSFRTRQDVSSIIVPSFANTLVLVIPTFLVAYGAGVTAGAFLAWKRGSRFERVVGTVALAMRGVPSFVIAVLLVLLFAARLGWLPSTGMRSGNFAESNRWAIYGSWDFLHHLILPVTAAAAFSSVVPMLLMRNTMLDVLDADYMDLVRAKGISERAILFRHGVRNALMPLLAEASQFIGWAIGGLVTIEFVFSWPGLGREIVNAVTARDYPVAQGAFLYIGALVMVVYFLADVLAVYLDPRLRRR